MAFVTLGIHDFRKVEVYVTILDLGDITEFENGMFFNIFIVGLAKLVIGMALIMAQVFKRS